MKRIILICLCVFAVQLAWAQKKQAVYLKNGSIINGTVKKEGAKVAVHTADGSVWVFEESAIEKIGKAHKNSFQKQQGFVSMTHFSLMVGRQSVNEWESATYTSPSIKTYIGYHISPRLALGFSTGIDGYSNMPLIPLALGVRGDVFRSSTTVYYGLDIGAALPWSTTEDVGWVSNTYRGGFLLSPMLGIKRYGHRGGGFYMQASWSMQKASSEFGNWGRGGGTSVQEYTYKRLQLGIGLFF